MTRLIKRVAALHIILTYYYNEFHFRIRDEEDVEVIEVLHSLYPLHRPVVAHCLADSLSQSIIRSSLKIGMVVVCIRVIGEGEDTFNLYTVGRYMHSTALGYMHGFTLR